MDNLAEIDDSSLSCHEKSKITKTELTRLCITAL